MKPPGILSDFANFKNEPLLGVQSAIGSAETVFGKIIPFMGTQGKCRCPVIFMKRCPHRILQRVTALLPFGTPIGFLSMVFHRILDLKTGWISIRAFFFVIH